MADVRTILPTGSTELERVIDTTLPRGWAALADSADPSATGRDARLLPWLAQQWQVAQFAPYFATVEALLEEAIPWLMERGSAASLRRVLRWLGYDDVTIDEDGAWLHLDLGRPVTAQELADVVKVVGASLPAHVRFFRVFHGHDLRPIVLDKGPALDAGMLDGYSGVLGDAGLVESYGVRAGGTLAASPLGRPHGAATQIRVSVSRYDDIPILDAWRLDSRVLAGVSGGVMELTTYTSNAPTPGAGTAWLSALPAGVAPWIAPAPVIARTDITADLGTEPVHPPHRWGGHWGGPWRDHFRVFTTEET